MDGDPPRVADHHGADRDAPRHGSQAPSAWVERFAALVPAGGAVLDLACGYGRHGRLFADRGHPVTAVDVDPAAIGAVAADPRIEAIAADLEAGAWPLGDRRFAGIVVTNYLWRPILPRLAAALDQGGVLIYETFAMGNERYGRPRKPAHLLRPGELLQAFAEPLCVVAYEHGIVDQPRPGQAKRLAVDRHLQFDQQRPAGGEDDESGGALDVGLFLVGSDVAWAKRDEGHERNEEESGARAV